MSGPAGQADPFHAETVRRGDGGVKHFNITPDDSNNLPTRPRSIWVGVAGDIAVVDEDGTEIVYPDVPVGVFPFSGVQIKSTGTTATNLVGWI